MSVEQLFRENYRTLCIYVTHIVDDIDEAEDIVMECFIRLTEQMEAGKEIAQPERYLYRMARNAGLDALKERRGETLLHELPELSDEADEEWRERCEREARLWQEIDRLPEACRRAFLMSKRDGMKYREIAEALHLSVKTVEAHISKAYALLRRRAADMLTLFFSWIL